MAVGKQIKVSAEKIDGFPVGSGTSVNVELAIDDIVWATVDADSKVYIVSSRTGGNTVVNQTYSLASGETLTSLIAKADATGYTQNSLRKVQVSKLGNQVYSTAKEYLIQDARRHKTQAVDNGDGTYGAKFQYEYKPNLTFKVVEVTDDLLDEGSGGSSGS